MAEDDIQPGDSTADTDGGDAASTAAAPATAPAASQSDGTLLSRIAGLDAKVTSLVGTLTAKEQELADLRKQVADAQAGVVDKDEALRAQIAAKDAELAQARTEAALANVKATYPETFGVLGAAAASLTTDQLAAAEARFAGIAGAAPNPTPVGTGAPRQPAPAAKAIEDMSVTELEAHLRSMPRSVLGLAD